MWSIVKLKKVGLFLIICSISFSGNTQEKNSDKVFREVSKEVKALQLQCPKCDNLNTISCVQKKIHCYVEIDQYVRNKITWPIIDDRLAKILANIDASNTKDLKLILRMYGWLTISKFGKVTDNEAWLLVQHADHDPNFQASIAFILEQLVEIGETDPQNFAYLYDRVAGYFQHIGLKQRYGTQATIKDGKIKLDPFEGTTEELNKRRKSIGLSPIEEYLKQLKAVYIK